MTIIDHAAEAKRLGATARDGKARHSIEQVRLAFGLVAAKLAEQGTWPDADELDKRLKVIAQRGRRRGRSRSKAGARYEAKAAAERFRQSFAH